MEVWRQKRAEELAHEAYLAFLLAAERVLGMKETQETLVVLREELSLTQADHMRIVQQIAQSKGAIKLSDPPRPPALRDPSPDYSARSESHDTSTPKSRPPKARGGTSKPAQSKPRLAPKAKAPPRPKDADAPAPSAAVATPARSNKRSAIKDRQTFMMGSSRMDSMNLTAEVTLIGRMIKKKRQMRDKSFEDGYIYDFDLNKHEHLVVYNPGQPNETHEWFNVHEMVDKQGMLVDTPPIPVAHLPRAACAEHVWAT